MTLTHERTPIALPAPAEYDPLTDTIDSSLETSPLFDEVTAEQEATSTESNVDASSSRLANLLRRSADKVDTASELWDDTKDRARKKLRLFGRSALRAGAATGELAVGVGLLAANKSLELADKADAALFDGIDAATTKTKDTYNAALDKTAELAMAGGAKLDAGMDMVGSKMNNLKEGVKERLIARKTAALERRHARRERWSQRLTSAKEAVNSGLDRTAELAMAGGAKLDAGMDMVGSKMISAKESAGASVERSMRSVHTTRAAGRAALEAYKATRLAHTEQNQLY